MKLTFNVVQADKVRGADINVLYEDDKKQLVSPGFLGVMVVEVTTDTPFIANLFNGKQSPARGLFKSCEIRVKYEDTTQIFNVYDKGTLAIWPIKKPGEV